MVQDASKLEANQILKMIDDFDKHVHKSLREYKEPVIFLHLNEIQALKKLGIIKSQ